MSRRRTEGNGSRPSQQADREAGCMWKEANDWFRELKAWIDSSTENIEQDMI